MSEEGDYGGELDENESKILIALVKLGNQYNQRELWRMAGGINSKTGIPALSKLERRGGFIERDKVGGGDKRSQYVIRLTEAGIKKAKTLMEGMKSGMGTDIELLMGIPCFFCPYIKECGRGGGHTSQRPVNCWAGGFITYLPPSIIDPTRIKPSIRSSTFIGCGSPELIYKSRRTDLEAIYHSMFEGVKQNILIETR